MKTDFKYIFYTFWLLAISSCTFHEPKITVEHDGDNALVHVDGKCRYLMLPVQENSWEVRVRAVDAPAEVPMMDIRLAADSIDYYVPYELPDVSGVRTVAFEGLWPGAVCWDNIKTADEPDYANYEKFRPLYHFSPRTGWMNDPNGMVYKDGIYHLYYQHNPYGSKWGNMHWGHASSTDLVTWKHHDVALVRDTLGHIYSGSAVVDSENCSGFGKDAIVAFYTAHDGPSETQCIAYSNDGGMTYTKYEGNPVIAPHDGIRDFRDPKVFRYEEEDKWVMVLAANYEVRFYASTNLKDWEYTGSFGKGYGTQPSLFECPDMIRLKVDDCESVEKWMLIVNVNPGGIFGGSATQYFIGEFDGRTFICDTPPDVSKWLDYGKDHYAAVTFSNTGDRVIAMAWMSNWQYADRVPTRQFRSANTLPRELGLFTCGSEVYASSYPVKEVKNLRGRVMETIDAPAFESAFTIPHGSVSPVYVSLSNEIGNELLLVFDMDKGELSMDRTQSGQLQCDQDFSVIASAPLELCDYSDGYDVDIYVDRSSVEVFVDKGRIAMTGLVFPELPYSKLSITDGHGESVVETHLIYELVTENKNAQNR